MHQPHVLYLRAVRHDRQRCQRVRCELSDRRGDATCFIFHLPTNDVEIAGLPSAWELNLSKGKSEVLSEVKKSELKKSELKKAFNTATLPCGHTFNPSALTLHFLLSDMRCPTCRVGPEARMDASCLPLELQQTFREHVRAIQERAKLEEESDFMQTLVQHTDISVQNLEDDITFVMEMYIPCEDSFNCRLLQTPLRVIPEHNSGSFVHYVTQYAFQRAFNQHVMSNVHNPRVTLLFHLQHPLLHQSISTQIYNLAELYNTITHQEFVAPLLLVNQSEARVMGTLVFKTSRFEDTERVDAWRRDGIDTIHTTHTGGTDTTDARHTGGTDDIQTIQPNTETQGTSTETTQAPTYDTISSTPPSTNNINNIHNAHATLLLHRDAILALCINNLQQSIQQSIEIVVQNASVWL